MKTIRFGLIVIAACALIVLAAGIKAAVWVHQTEAIAVEQELVSAQELILRQNTAALLELANAQLGYVLTGDPSYLEPFEQSRRDIASALAKLDALLPGGPARAEDIAELAKLAHAEEAAAAQAIQLRRDGQREAALAAAASDDGKHLLQAYQTRQGAIFDQLRLQRFDLAGEYTSTFRSLYILLAMVVLVVDLLIVVAIVTLSVAIQRLREQQREHEQVAMHDALTGLPNRRYLGEWLTMSLAAARRSGQRLVILYFDLDGFKAVNDNFGHEAGDRVLQVIASRLRRAMRISDFVARLGGDEFVAALPEAPTPAALAMLIERLQAEIAKAPIVELRDGAVRASIGTATFPNDGDTVDTILAAADRAMYEVKQNNRKRSPRLVEIAQEEPDHSRSAAQ